MLKSRIITAVILVLLLSLVLFVLPDGWWDGLVVLVAVQGALEWSKLSRLSAGNTILYILITLACMLLLLWFDASHSDAGQFSLHALIYAFSALLWLIVVPLWMAAGWRVENRLLMCLIGWVVLIPTCLAMLDLYAMSPWVLLLLMSLVWVADIGAYFSGRRFGKHKLAPSISPGKTWEGVAGGMLGASLYVVALWYVIPFAGLSTLLLLGCCWVVLAVIGDLFESAVKRQAGVKDSGELLPGHGGLLDRIDALTSTLPLAALAILLQPLI